MKQQSEILDLGSHYRLVPHDMCPFFLSLHPTEQYLRCPDSRGACFIFKMRSVSVTQLDETMNQKEDKTRVTFYFTYSMGYNDNR